MTPDASAQHLRDDYLARLDTALQHLPYGVATDIRAGIIEGFDGLDAQTLQERIRDLGDPETIAREATAETWNGTGAGAPPVSPVVGTASAVTPVAAAAPKVPLGESKGFAIAAALILGFAGIIVPVGGWITGVVLVVTSRLWNRWEKLVAILTPPATTLLLVAVSAISDLMATGPHAEDQSIDPLMPVSFDVIWSSAVLTTVILVPVCGAWLLWRLKGRTEPVTRP